MAKYQGAMRSHLRREEERKAIHAEYQAEQATDDATEAGT